MRISDWSSDWCSSDLKTTTLYASLAALNTPERKILTIEDPIEYRLAGISQTQVAPRIGLSFAAALRFFLRPAPDVMMVSDIRDLETAPVAVQADRQSVV